MSDTSTDPLPNPGSVAAFALGCICPPEPNNNGEFAPGPPNGWWIDTGCPLHAFMVMDVTPPGPDPEPAVAEPDPEP